jgi:hypothetical protein
MRARPNNEDNFGSKQKWIYDLRMNASRAELQRRI